ncbi:hypothetical protein SK128_001572 [Halocaridina rubra]|uniref:EGF-like domain-containing protein n=1 Tax=Halocaridina rubra TaxID=373956 RepID=A0AAN9AE24_HALRR
MNVKPPHHHAATSVATCGARLQYVEEPRVRLPIPSRRSRPSPSGYPTSEFQERLLQQFYAELSCPRGFHYVDNECRDVDECALPERCQHHCENTNGSYICLCPPGYRLNINQRTCDGVTYAHILAFKTASLPAGIIAYQDLVRLMAYDQAGNLVPQTLFTIIENDTGIPFRIRLENGKGILRTLQPLTAGAEYRMEVEAVSYDENEHSIKYSTRFIIYLHISEYPY